MGRLDYGYRKACGYDAAAFGRNRVSAAAGRTRIDSYSEMGGRQRNFAYGLLFGAAGIVSMLLAGLWAPGIYIDIRTLIAAMAGIAGGIPTAVTALIILAVVRIAAGGIGMTAGLIALGIATGIGLAAGYLLRTRNIPDRSVTYGSIGLLLSAAMLLCTVTLLPETIAREAFQRYLIPLPVTYTLGAILFGLALRKVRASVKSDRTEQLKGDLMNAWERGEMSLVFQPQIEAASGHIRGVETLLRWQHPKLGAVSPAEFIPIAEQTGLIHKLGGLVLNQACDMFTKELRPIVPEAVISVNVSSIQITPTFAEMVADALKRTGMKAQNLELEITESVLIDSVVNAQDLLEQVRRLGVHLALDDFGTGYSSLHYLDHLPLTQLKLDKALIQRIAETKQTFITESIIQLSHRLGIQVVAEGVEEPGQLEKLKELDCDIIQGYLFSKPLQVSELKAFIQDIQKTNRF